MKLRKSFKPVKQNVKKGNRHLVSRHYETKNVDVGDFKMLKPAIIKKVKKILKRNKLKKDDEIQIIVKIEDGLEQSHYIAGHLTTFKNFESIKMPNLSINKKYGSFDNTIFNNFYTTEIIINIFH